jgi:hypothetical protein
MQNDPTALPDPLAAVLDSLIHSDEETSGQPVLASGTSAVLLEWLRRVMVSTFSS